MCANENKLCRGPTTLQAFQCVRIWCPERRKWWNRRRRKKKNTNEKSCNSKWLKNLHNIIVSGDEFHNDSKQYEDNTGETDETGAGQSGYIFVQTQWDDNANGYNKYDTESYLGHCRIPRWHQTYQHFWQCVADDHIVRNHCCACGCRSQHRHRWTETEQKEKREKRKKCEKYIRQKKKGREKTEI